MICSVCGKPAIIRLGNEGDFCSECYNKRIEDRYGPRDHFEFPQFFSVKDPVTGKRRNFQLSYIDHIYIYTWIAQEEGTDYCIEYYSYPGENPETVVKNVLNNIREAVTSKTRNTDGTLNEKGTMKFAYDSESNEYGFQIDGRYISMNEFRNSLPSWEGFQLQYRIVDAGEPVLGNGELLQAVQVGYDEITFELDMDIEAVCNGGEFVNFQDAEVFRRLYSHIYSKLELMIKSADFHTEGIRTAYAVIERLKELSTNEKCFPDDLIAETEALIRMHER